MAITGTGSAAAVFLLMLIVAANAALPHNVGGFEQRKNEIDECALLCVNEYLCACNVSNSEKRYQCCLDYCTKKCGSGAVGSCGDLPEKPNCQFSRETTSSRICPIVYGLPTENIYVFKYRLFSIRIPLATGISVSNSVEKEQAIRQIFAVRRL